ncbi:MAG: DEAD/DEAH box helicase [Actinomycetota bacterium]|nr:DEAD/DEAH box helicase [Actinomycetota bacterium]
MSAKATEILTRNGFTLRDYQKEGLKWMRGKEKGVAGAVAPYGGILADEMGLGKTIQMISLIISGEGTTDGPTLIVVPTSLMTQWKSEIAKFTGGTMRVEIAHNSDPNGLLIELMRTQVYITSYGTVARNMRVFGDASITWGRIILDEAHMIRNSRNKTTVALMSLKAHNRWCISGTPIQNGAKDMVTLLEFIGFQRKIAKKRMKEIVAERMLLRTKKGTGIELPPVKREVVDIKMSPSEFRVYDFVDEHIDFELVRQLKKRQATILKRMVSEFYSGEFDDVEPEEWHEINIDNFRLDKTLEIASKVGNGVIFADFRAEIDYIKRNLETRGKKVAVIHGGVPVVQRKEVLDTQADYDFVIIQIYAGGTGLNLQRFNNVIINSPHWNPFIEEQAIARVHRIGQQREVKIFHLVEKETIDADIVSVQDVKKQVWEDVSRDEGIEA